MARNKCRHAAVALVGVPGCCPDHANLEEHGWSSNGKIVSRSRPTKKAAQHVHGRGKISQKRVNAIDTESRICADAGLKETEVD